MPFKSLVEDLISGKPRTNPASGQERDSNTGPWIASPTHERRYLDLSLRNAHCLAYGDSKQM